MLKIPAIHYGSIFVILLAWISLINHAKCQEALICSSSTTTITLGYESKHYKYPGSGATYPQSSTCKWLFQASDTSTQIMFKVDKLYVDCGDIFVFYSGTSPSGTKIGSEICCSSTCSGASRNDQTSAGRDLFLQFISDSSTSTPGDEAGFELYITVGKDASQCSSSSNTALALTATSTPALLTSPNFFNFYSENYNCTYTYTAATSGNIVTFQFIYLQVELHAGTCYDFVALYDGASSSSTQIASPFCGDTYQPNLIYNSTGNMMTVYFVSTAGVPKRGFSALVYETDSGATTSGAVDTTTSTVETTSTSETVTTANAVDTTTSTVETTSTSETVTTANVGTTTSSVDTTSTSAKVSTQNVETTSTESTLTSSSSSRNVDTSSPEETTSVTSISSTANVDTSSPEETTSVTSSLSTVNVDTSSPEETTSVTSSLSTVIVDTSSPEETSSVTSQVLIVNVDTTSPEETTSVTPVLTTRTINGPSSSDGNIGLIIALVCCGVGVTVIVIACAYLWKTRRLKCKRWKCSLIVGHQKCSLQVTQEGCSCGCVKIVDQRDIQNSFVYKDPTYRNEEISLQTKRNILEKA